MERRRLFSHSRDIYHISNRRFAMVLFAVSMGYWRCSLGRGKPRSNLELVEYEANEVNEVACTNLN